MMSISQTRAHNHKERNNVTLMSFKGENGHMLNVKYGIYGPSMTNLHGFLMRLCKSPHTWAL